MKKIVEIEKLDNFGRGIAYFNDKICFVKNAYPKEKVEIEIIKEYKNYIEAESKNIITKSEDRIDIESPFLYSGFPFMNYKREKELEYKENLIKELFSKYTNNIKNIVYVDNLDYRNKITVFKNKKNIGVLKENSHEILNVSNLLFVNKRIKEEYNLIKNEQFNKLMIRTNGKDVIKIYDDKYNDDYLIDTLLNYKFKIRTKSFYQVNKEICEKLYLKIKEYLNKEDKVLDLYSGISTISICISDKVKEVVGVEINKSSYLDSIDNIKMNNISNVKSYNMDVINYLDNYKDFNIIIVDPPRKGLDKKLINYLNSDKLIYISCNPITLKRDLELLKDRYKVVEITPFDMFSRTAHTETVALLSKLDVDKHISVKIELDELDLTSAESKATYAQIKEYILEKFGLKVSALYIAQIKKKCGIELRENYNKSKKEKQVIPQCTSEKEEAIMDALRHFKMI